MGLDEDAARMVAHLDEPVRSLAEELAKNVLWMADKLAEARRVIASSSVVIPYDNGGGQRGVRKNPAFESYNALLSQYSRATAQLAAMIGDGGEGDGDAIDSIIADREPGAVLPRRSPV